VLIEVFVGNTIGLKVRTVEQGDLPVLGIAMFLS
jgi:hypothetical protein